MRCQRSGVFGPRMNSWVDSSRTTAGHCSFRKVTNRRVLSRREVEAPPGDEAPVDGLTVEEWRTLLADNSDLVQGLFRTVREHPAFGRDQILMEGSAKSAAEKVSAGNGIVSGIHPAVANTDTYMWSSTNTWSRSIDSRSR